MSGPRRIGILGGMGPEATVELMSRLIAATPARDDFDHIPLLVDMNPQVPSRIARLIEGRGADPGPVLAQMACGLEQAGVAALAMPCNTAHHYAPVIRAAVTIPFIDMVERSAALAVARAGQGTQIGILGSPALRQIGIFDAALARHGASAAYPTDQPALLEAIRQIKAAGPSAAAAATLGAAAADLAGRGAGVQLVACTEFSLIAHAAAEQADTLDTLDVLVGAIVEFALGPDHVRTKVKMTASAIT
ncbi:aspartate/glutamate racemase family protein [Paracoccus yeei]|uniref:Aspartate/glutamate racemase family protein n=1 Tax=Paracoccus yeei TaxID=147645 RepID=A0A1V0GV43_9RHOB|nr:amino acid racemase [Paracoccus yeei]ARC37736.1 aspartate/glutamate racemase family protein [Paracoccus yeei]